MIHKHKEGNRVWVTGKREGKPYAFEYVVEKVQPKYDLIPADPNDGRIWVDESAIFATEEEALIWNKQNT